MKEIKVFIAGSKSLTIARDAIRSVLQILSNNNAKKVLIRTYTYEEFDTSLSPEGRQKEYNRFIMNEADYVIFVLDGTIGGVTLEEFDVAWKTFTSKNRPGIYVYHKPTATISKEIQKVIDKINQCGQYYTEYSDIENLKLKIENSFHRIIGDIGTNPRGSIFKATNWLLIGAIFAIITVGLFGVKYYQQRRLSAKEVCFEKGEDYYNGNGVAQDYVEATIWYQKAAEQGYAPAQMRLGSCYYHGEGVAQDYTEAVKWYRLAVAQDHAGAQNNLGVCYYFGHGVRQDYAEAIKWFEKSAEKVMQWVSLR